jgi:hypothetical protein
MINYVRFLTEKRSSLKQPAHSKEEEKSFGKGKKAMAHSEIERINSHTLLGGRGGPEGGELLGNASGARRKEQGSRKGGGGGKNLLLLYLTFPFYN